MTQKSSTVEIEETLIGRITRPVLFSHSGVQRMPAGTEVYVLPTRERGQWLIRIPGTLLTQKVYFGTVEPS